MTNEEFDTLVFKLEHQARGNPGRYQFQVLKAFTLKLIFVVGFFLWVLLRALWVKVPTTVNFHGETFILNCEGDNYRFGRKLRWLRWARVI